MNSNTYNLAVVIRRGVPRVLLALAAPLASINVVQAQAPEYPIKVVRIVVPFPAGGSTDVIGRILSERMRTSLGQTVIIENVAGAGGTTGISRAAAAAAYQVTGEILPSDHGKLSLVVREPLGVVSVISPWNFPLILSSRGFATALAVGNAIVLKPSEKTPLVALKFAQLLHEAGLPGPMLSVLLGPTSEVAEVLVGHPEVEVVAFTGSVPVGKKIAVTAGYKKLVLELGGNDPLIILEDADLAARLVLDGLAHEADRVHVLDLTARAEFVARLAHRDIDVAAHGALVHVAIAGAKVAHDRAQLGEIRRRLVGRAQVWLADDLHKSHAGAVEIDIGLARVLVVQAFAGILLEMQPLNADLPGDATLQIDLDHALAYDRILVLRDLVAGRQVRVEVVLAVEHRAQVDLGVQAEPGPHRLLEMWRRGVDVGLGTDGAASWGPLDIFQVAHMARVGQQAVNGTPFAYRNVMPSEEILKVATNGGARSLGLEKQIGSLEVGKKADILLIDRTNLDQMPVQDIYFIAANIVVGRDVKTVVIDGNVVMKDRELLTVDREEIDRRLAERLPKLMERFDKMTA